MDVNGDKNKTCFGVLEHVFPPGEDGLRHSPENCMSCEKKTECLREAMRSRHGDKVHEESVDRAYESGNIGFFSRWSKKKLLNKKR